MRPASTPISLRWLAFLALFLVTLLANAQSPPTWQWALQTTNPTPTDGTAAVGTLVATDATGRAYVGGNTGGTFAVPGAVRNFGTAGTLGPVGGGFVAQASSAGRWNWVTALQATGANSNGLSWAEVTTLVVTAGGTVYAGGVVRGTGLQVGTQSQPVSTGTALFVATLTSTGVCQRLTLVNGLFTTPTLALDPSTGGVVLATYYFGRPTLGTILLPASSSPASGWSLLVARLAPTGQWQSTATAMGSGVIQADVAVAVGAAGQVAVGTTQTSGTFSFGPTTLTVPTGLVLAFAVAQLSPANQWQWAVGGNGSGTRSDALGVAYTASGALWVSGRGKHGTQVGPLTLQVPGSRPDAFAGFAARLSATGQWEAVHPIVPNGQALVTMGPPAVDASGNAVMMGEVGGAGPIQTAVGNQVITSPAGAAVDFIASINVAGPWQLLETIPTPVLADGLYRPALALDGTGGLYVTGGLRGSLTLGTTALFGSYDPGATTSNWGDVMLAHLVNAAPLSSQVAHSRLTLEVFPNPARGAVTLALPPEFTSAPAVVTLVNALGQRVWQQRFPARGSSLQIDVHGVAPGVYTAQVQAGQKTAIERLVVR